MLKLGASAHEPYWLDLIDGVRLKVRPVTIAAIIVARNEAAKVFRIDEEPVGSDTEANQDAKDPQTGAKASAALVGSLARFAISEWDGIGDDGDAPAPVTPENVDKLLTLWPVYRAFDEKYVSPALAGQAEGNGSGKPPGGISRAGKSTAGLAA